MILGFARFKNQFGKSKKTSTNSFGKVMQKTLKIINNRDPKWNQKPSKKHPKIDAEKK